MLLDELQRLHQSAGLLDLLKHYAGQNLVAPDAWLDRLMQIEGADDRDLVRWHGELIAFGWIEQNTGVTPACRQGVIASCYRITSAGRRALRDIQAPADAMALPQDGAGEERKSWRGRKAGRARKKLAGAESQA
jgi:hypothetical protein